MKKVRLITLIFLLPLFAFVGFHKYYVSVTQINYIKEKHSVQITSRIFIDDFENLLRKRYDENITLADKDELEIVDTYIKEYLKQKIKIKINNKEAILNFLGKEYDGDIMRCYLEIEDVKAIKTFKITNQLLLDLYQQQQNIVKTNINSKQKSMLLILQNDNALLNFN